MTWGLGLGIQGSGLGAQGTGFRAGDLMCGADPEPFHLSPAPLMSPRVVPEGLIVVGPQARKDPYMV